MISLFKKTVNGLTKTRKNLKRIFSILSGKKMLTDDELEELEAILLQADLGWDAVNHLMNEIGKPTDKGLPIEDRFCTILKSIIPTTESIYSFKKNLIIVGINGTGKTTSAAKLAAWFKAKGDNPLLVGADTYRAAAVEQLKQWASKLEFQLIANEKSSDPASVAFDGVKAGQSRNMDRIIIDSAGRLHTSDNLMRELEKIYKVVSKLTDDLQVLITIDANTGQNGLNQTREFNKYIPLDGIILTKMDGTARGGIAVPIMMETELPVFFIGVGESEQDLIPFDLDVYLRGLISENNKLTIPAN